MNNKKCVQLMKIDDRISNNLHEMNALFFVSVQRTIGAVQVRDDALEFVSSGVIKKASFSGSLFIYQIKKN